MNIRKDSAPAVVSTSISQSHIDEAGDREDIPVGGGDEKGGGKAEWLNRNVIGMGLTSLLSDVSHEAATAVLPLFMADSQRGRRFLVESERRLALDAGCAGCRIQLCGCVEFARSKFDFHFAEWRVQEESA